ncbi:MAG TPA: class I SAM-dependent methyltransferase [Candidatus Paceibacterota bacterium]|jgi:ubiquinone/menaquinone biosynthesis C-methylase UbiE|nr:class I SAM-dependent methyltransferase [Candidatus Paceibacterota bacterium]
MFSDPRHNIEQLGLSDGAIVADFGAGSGFYAIEAAKAVAPSGTVYAIDIQKDLLDRLKKEAEHFHVRGIEIIAGDVERLGGTRIADGKCDVVIASNILFMLKDRKNLVLEAKRILKPNGRLLVIDWAASFSQMGPRGDHVVYKDDAMNLGVSAGLEFEREIHAGAHHYGIIFRKR